MTKEYNTYQIGVQRARDLVGLGQSLGHMTNGVVDAADLYRAALTQAVSALDQYVHSVVLGRAARIILGQLPAAADGRFGLGLNATRQILAASSLDVQGAIEAHLASALAKVTFQAPDDIANGLSPVGVGKVWSTAFGGQANQVKKELSLVVFRRNRIVHQCDADPLTPGVPTLIDAADALAAIATIEKVVKRIDALC